MNTKLYFSYAFFAMIALCANNLCIAMSDADSPAMYPTTIAYVGSPWRSNPTLGFHERDEAKKIVYGLYVTRYCDYHKKEFTFDIAGKEIVFSLSDYKKISEALSQRKPHDITYSLGQEYRVIVKTDQGGGDIALYRKPIACDWK